MTKYFYKKQHQTSITPGVLGQSGHISLSRRLDKQVLEMSLPVIKQKQGDSTTCKKNLIQGLKWTCYAMLFPVIYPVPLVDAQIKHGQSIK